MRAAAVLVLSLLTACGNEPPARVNLGDAAPAAEARHLDGTRVQVPAAFAGKPLVMRCWADWCRYCEGEMKGIEPVYQRYRGRGLEVLAINVGQDPATAEAFGRRLGISYPVLVDQEAAVARRYGVVGLPTTFFVDSQGIIRGKIVGEADAADFERQLQVLLP